MATLLSDQYGRALRDLRLSVTDRCNFRCPYCMPRDVFGPDHAFVPRSELLSYEELARLVKVFAGLGVTKVRLTGGEPLLRRDIDSLVAMIAAQPGIDDVAMTTNGSLLADRAAGLKAAGLSRVTVSLDSVDPDVFATLSDAKVPLAAVLDGIDAAREAGLAPVKLNAVIQRGVNDSGVLDLVEFARREGLVLRFIEYMDVGTSNQWARDQVVPSAEIIERVAAVHPVVPSPPTTPGEVARRWTFADGRGEIGVISSVTEPFCGDCTRARVTATGELFTCLFAEQGRDLRTLLRSDATDDALAQTISGIWSVRDDRYSELRSQQSNPSDRPEMSYLGG
jgi:cyclic pyranopterin phosphate synthase